MPGPPVDLVDETFVVADRTLLARQISDPALWLEWWPDLRLSMVTDRGVDGIRWSVSGALSGTAEIWLEPWQDGVVVHWFLRAGLPPRGSRDTGLPAAPAGPGRSRNGSARACGTATRRPSSAGSTRSRTTSSAGARRACPAGTADR
jgi:hypothetical protein